MSLKRLNSEGPEHMIPLVPKIHQGHARCILVSITYHWRYVPVYPDYAVRAQHHLVWGIKQRAEGVQ
jgi:hypothetical protein